jgi:hypothetical protein
MEGQKALKKPRPGPARQPVRDALFRLNKGREASDFIFYFGDIILRKKKMKSHSFFSQTLV